MTDKSDKLEQAINQFHSINPTQEQFVKWYLAILKKKNERRNLFRQSLSIAVVLAIGIVIGGFFFNRDQDQKLEDFSATFVKVSVKNLAEN